MTSQENAVIEGTIGKLEHAEFVEDMVLEVQGRKGVLRIDISENEIKEKEKELMLKIIRPNKEVN